MPRYALYYAPPSDSRLWTAGVRWLGRDPESGATVAPPTVHGLPPARQSQLTESARRYGWHATLKAPFALAEGWSRDQLLEEMQRFCSRRERFPLPSLEVGVLDGFVALVPPRPSGMLQQLAADCVEYFDPLRAPQSAAERSRRNPASLTDRQREHLDRWGYPHVMDDYRFHLTLTERLAAADQAALLPWLERWFAPALAETVSVDALALFEEPARGASLRLVRRVPFGG